MNFILRYEYITISFIWIELVIAISPNKNIYLMDLSIGDIADYIASKGYIPNDKELPRVPLIKNNDNDATYLLSKLSDEELLKLLNEQPQRNEYDLNDIMKIALNPRKGQNNRFQHSREHTGNENPNFMKNLSIEKKRFHTITNNEPTAYFKLNHKEVEGQNDDNYIVLQKLKSLLNIYSQPKSEDNEDDDDDKKQLIFDILVAQLKTLCCKKSKKPDFYKGQQKILLGEILPSSLKKKLNIPNRISSPIDFSNSNHNNEFMFLIINDEIKSNGSDELISVDPESLDGNSSVLLLGPVTSPLTDEQLKLIMSRISNELTKPEYTSLLQQLSEGVLFENNKHFIKNFVFGPQTRRYIKPHRCNHQSKLAKVYGGPKWIVCTGYLNLNKPSLYD